MNKKDICRFFKIMVFLIIVLFILFGIIPLFINFLVNTNNPFGLGFINEKNKDTWINFFGATISGCITLLGVWWTIKNQEDKRRKDLSIQYRPIFTCSIKK